MRLRDYKGNESWITIPIVGKKKTPKPAQNEIRSSTLCICRPIFNIGQDNGISVYIPEDTFYDSFHIDFAVRSDTLTLT